MKTLLLLLALAAIGACGGGGGTRNGGLCSKNSDCESEYCFAGECGGEACSSSSECDSAAVCTNLGDSTFSRYCYRPCSSGCPAQEHCTSTGYCGI